jgi:hypothetical protein
MAIAPVTSAGSETSFMVCQLYWTLLSRRGGGVIGSAIGTVLYLLVHYLE